MCTQFPGIYAFPMLVEYAKRALFYIHGKTRCFSESLTLVGVQRITVSRSGFYSFAIICSSRTLKEDLWVMGDSVTGVTAIAI